MYRVYCFKIYMYVLMISIILGVFCNVFFRWFNDNFSMVLFLFMGYICIYFIEYLFFLFCLFWLIWVMLFGVVVLVDNLCGVFVCFMGNVWVLFVFVFFVSYIVNLVVFMIIKNMYYDLEGIIDWWVSGDLVKNKYVWMLK